MTEEKANELSSCGNGCFIIGGPWISTNPSCPVHGENRKELRLLTREEAESCMERALIMSEVENIQRKFCEINDLDLDT